MKLNLRVALKCDFIIKRIALTFRSIFTLWEEPKPWLGAGHGEDVPLVFGWPFIEDLVTYTGFNLTAEEMELSHKIIQFWTNFAKSG